MDTLVYTYIGGKDEAVPEKVARMTYD